MEGINPDTERGMLFEYLISNINAQLKLLDMLYKAKVRDEQDFEYYLDEIYYSPAQYEVIGKFKNIKGGLVE